MAITVEFDDYGGREALCGAFLVRREDHILCRIEIEDYLVIPNNVSRNEIWEELHSKNDFARYVAEEIRIALSSDGYLNHLRRKVIDEK